MAQGELDVTQPLAGTSTVAIGDGVADDRAAIQARLDAAATAAGGCVYLPPGSYRLSGTLHVAASPSVMTLRGCGDSSHLLWAFDDHLLVWDGRCDSADVRDLKITATVDQRATSTALRAHQGVSRLRVAGVRIEVSDPAGGMRFGGGVSVAEPGLDPPPSRSGNLRFEGLQLQHFRGDAIRLMDATDVWIRDCRFAALRDAGGAIVAGTIGVHLAGNTGGVWVRDCDIDEAETAIRVERTKRAFGHRLSRSRWNRELFVSGGACDGGGHGIVVEDHTFVTLTGCWLASNDFENLLVPKGWKPTLEVTGGILFNAGSWIDPKPSPPASHGAVILGGAFSMAGTMVDNNAGCGLIVGSEVHGFTVSGCVFRNNWLRQAEYLGACGSVAGNTYLLGIGLAPNPPLGVGNTTCP
jgi:Pectate lyase superfamily protein